MPPSHGSDLRWPRSSSIECHRALLVTEILGPSSKLVEAARRWYAVRAVRKDQNPNPDGRSFLCCTRTPRGKGAQRLRSEEQNQTRCGMVDSIRTSAIDIDRPLGLPPNASECLKSHALTSPPASDSPTEKGATFNQLCRIFRQAAKEISEVCHANSGVGRPTLVPEHLPLGIHVRLQIENGALACFHEVRLAWKCMGHWFR